MKILVTSDWHPDHVTHGVPRLDDVSEAAWVTVEHAKSAKVDAYLFTGDLCDPDAGGVTFRCVELAIEVAMALHEVGIPSVWIAGNHDVIEDGSGSTTLAPLKGLRLDDVSVCEHPEYVMLPDLDLVALPFTASSHTYDPAWALEQAATARKGAERTRPVMIAAHLAVPGVVPGEETTDMPRGRDVVFPIAAAKRLFPDAVLVNGHYHRRQTSADGVVIPGSLCRLTFNEEQNAPCFLVVET